jgi:hypothetical protein
MIILNFKQSPAENLHSSKEFFEKFNFKNLNTVAFE